MYDFLLVFQGNRVAG